MPPKSKKSTFQRKSRKLYSDYKKKKPDVHTMVNKSSLRDHTVIADRFMTKMSASYVGTLAPSGAAALEFTVYGNSIYIPFTTGNPINTTIGAQQGSVITVPPMGYTALTALYSSYRVRSSRIKISTNPTSLNDPMIVTVLPVQANFAQTTPRFVQNQRYSRWKTCTSSNNVKENTIIHYMPSCDVLGLTKTQYDNQLPIAVGSVPPASLDWYWQVALDTATGGVNTNSVAIQVEVDFYVELSDPVNLTA